MTEEGGIEIKVLRVRVESVLQAYWTQVSKIQLVIGILVAQASVLCLHTSDIKIRIAVSLQNNSSNSNS